MLLCFLNAIRGAKKRENMAVTLEAIKVLINEAKDDIKRETEGKQNDV